MTTETALHERVKALEKALQKTLWLCDLWVPVVKGSDTYFDLKEVRALLATKSAEPKEEAVEDS